MMSDSRQICAKCECSVLLAWDAYIMGDEAHQSSRIKIKHRLCLRLPPTSNEVLSGLVCLGSAVFETQNHSADGNPIDRKQIDGYYGYREVKDDTVACHEFRWEDKKEP